MALRELIFICGVLLTQLTLCNGFQCFSCDSNDDTDCATLKSNMTDAECPDRCAVWVDGIVTYRGCESMVPEGALSYFCEFNGCNKIIFPDERIKCAKCSADEDFCTYPSADLLYPCSNYKEDDLCYTYVISETSAIRGCLSDLDDNVNLCESAGESCVKCNEEFCNMQGGKSYIACTNCSSEANEACGYTQENVPESDLCEELLGRDNLCFAYLNQSHVVRGCLNDFPDLKPFCSENSEDCQICDDDYCNSMKMVQEHCYTCDSSVDPDCKNVAEVPTPTLCGEGSIDKSGCYLSDKDGVTKRGCVTTLDDTALKECQDGVDCKICHDSMCNVKPTFQRCFTCNSQDDPSCATLQDDLPETLCDDYLDTCKVYVKPNMTTHRGCYKEMSGDGVECLPQSVNCKQCSDNNCNGEVFPATRLSCFHCDEATADDECYNNLEGNTELSFPCEIYNFRDSCYFYIDDDLVVHRGCMSDQVDLDTCLNDPIKCQMCQTSNCNSESVMRDPEISCMTCDTYADGEECNWGWKESLAAKCKKPRFFYEDESCYVLTVTNQTLRGCTLDGNVCKRSLRCNLCGDDACNRINTAEQFCYKCSSEEDENCKLAPETTNNVSCPGVIEFAFRGCYTWIDENDSVNRGCFSDFNADDRTKCAASSDSCEVCIDDYCNSDTKGSVSLMTFNFMLVVSLLVTCKLFI